MYESLLRFPGDLFPEFDRFQREMQMFGATGMPYSIRAVARGAFPAVNIGSTPRSVEIYAFAPGIEPAKLQVSVDRGLLTLAGERKSDVPEKTDGISVYGQRKRLRQRSPTFGGSRSNKRCSTRPQAVQAHLNWGSRYVRPEDGRRARGGNTEAGSVSGQSYYFES